ncbi:MAG: outer membrane protein assembly factor BamD [Rhodocyclaceae bacterium]|nr:outer membrane protein assembly factor BamD [Rhodocyclaceae bacterium]
MSRRLLLPLLIGFCLVGLPFRSPAPLIYRPGEGWTYEPVGSEGRWTRTRAKDQMDVAQAAFDKKDYGLALRAAKRVSKVWPLSDYAPQAQYLAGRCYEEKGAPEKAFKEYQKILEKNPKVPNYPEILERQYEIANQFLGGRWFKLWGYIPVPPSMDRTADMYGKVVKNGPYSEIAPQAQLKIGEAHEKKKTLGIKTPDYPSAAKAYETAADRYHDRPKVASEAFYRQGLAYNKQAQTAEYDQNTAGQAIASFTDFMTLFPNDPRVSDAQNMITDLKTEQARGYFRIAQFYEKRRKYKGAIIYYNEAWLLDPNSDLGTQARTKIDELKPRTVAGAAALPQTTPAATPAKEPLKEPAPAPAKDSGAK